MNYNIYDFDKTIYDGDSSIDFYLFCLKRHPIIIKYLPIQIKGMVMFLFQKISKEKMKELYFSFFKLLPNIEDDLTLFWKKNKVKIKPWYLNKQKENDIIISASPTFLLEPIIKELKIKNLIATKVNPKTGVFTGKNCYGSEKVIRLNKLFASIKINEFYSDSLSDAPLANISNQAFIITKNTLTPFQEYKEPPIKKIIKLFLSKEFILFIFVGVINTVNGILFSYLYSLVLNPNLAFIVGYITSLTISYLLNSFISFKETLTFNKYIKFCISYIPNFIIQNIIVIIFLNGMHWPKLIVYALAAIIGLPITFLCMKLFAFKKQTY